MDRQNLTLMTDLYELTMMQGYYKNKTQNETVIFDAFYRNNPCAGGYAICAGLEQVIQYIKELRFDKEDIDYLSSLGIFRPDFLEYLRSFRFSGDIYCHVPQRTDYQSDCSYYGSPVGRDGHFEHHQPSKPYCHQGCQSLLCGPGRRNHGIRPAPRPRS